jgi:hypothetical protein
LLQSGRAILVVEDAESLGIGTYSISAQYQPNSQVFAASSGTVNQTVNAPGLAVTNGNNTFNGNQTVNGTLTATSLVGSGAGLTSLNPASLTGGTAGINITGSAASATTAATASNSTALGGVAAASYARVDIGNSFSGNQTVTGNLTVSAKSVTTGTTTLGSGGTPIVQHVSLKFNPSFPALKASTCASASFTFTGTSDGDTLALGVPNERMTGGGSLIYTAWVSAVNTVTIRGCNLSPTTAQKSAGSGLIRVDLWKH